MADNTTPIASLRHLYQQMVNGAVKDSAQAKRIAAGLLGPAIEKLEYATRSPLKTAEGAATQIEPTHSKHPFFSYDPDVGFETHKTEQEAQQAAKESIAQYRDLADETWPEEATEVYYGLILGESCEIDSGVVNDEGNRCVEFELRPVQAAPQPQVEPAGASAADVTDEMVHAALRVQRPNLYRDFLRHPANSESLAAKTEQEINTARKMIAATLATTQPAAAVNQQLTADQQTGGIKSDEDCILVPRGLLGAACSALARHDESPKTLHELRRYTAGDLSKAQPAPVGEYPALPEPVTWLIERSAFHVSPHGQDAESNEWLEEAHEPGEKDSFTVYTEQQMRAYADATHAMRAGEQEPVAWLYSFTHSSAIGYGDMDIGPVVTKDRKAAFGVGCFNQQPLYTSPVATQGEQEQPEDAIDEPMTPVQIMHAERARRELWDSINGPLDWPGLHEQDATRYRYLRGRDVNAIDEGGVFAGMTPENVVLNGEDLDAAIDAALSATTPPVAKDE